MVPNDNLGTAHARIRIDVEDRGTDRLLRTLTRMSRQFDELNKSVIHIEKTLSTTNFRFKDTSVKIDRTTRSTKNFSSGIFQATKNVSSFKKDTEILIRTLERLSNAQDRISYGMAPFISAYRTIDKFNKLKMDGSTNGLLAFSRAMSATGIASLLAHRAASRFLGIRDEMRSMPRWTKNMSHFATAVSSFALISKQLVKRGGIGSMLPDFTGMGMAIALDNVRKFAVANKRIIQSVVLMRSGIRGIVQHFRFLSRIPDPIRKGILLTISRVLPLALNVLSKALTGFSNLLLGALDGIKQLSGGLLILPGLFAAAGAMATSLMPVFKGLGAAFKDIFSSDPTKAFEAYAKLPEHLRPLADVLKGLVPKWKEFTKALQVEAFAGLEKQIDQIANGWLPAWERGAKKVIIATRGIKDEFVAFLGKQRTMKSASLIWARTAEGLNNLKGSIQPVLSGLQDIAVVGVGFLRDMTPMMAILLKQFGEWAAANRDNGNLLKWMQESREGFHDLANGIENASSGLWKILTMFRSNQGEDGLERFAKSMGRFNEAIDKSAASGKLRDISNFMSKTKKDWETKTTRNRYGAFKDMMPDFISGQGMENIGKNKLGGGTALNNFLHHDEETKANQLKYTVHLLADAFKAVATAVQTVSESFSAEFIPAIQHVAQFVTLIANLKHTLGLDTLIGTLLGFAAALKLNHLVLRAVFNALKLVGGAILFVTNAAKVAGLIETAFLKAATGLSVFGAAGRMAGSSILGVADASKKAIGVVSALAGKMMAAAVVMALAWWAISSRNDTIKKGLDGIADSAQHVKEAGQNIKAAFIDDGGLKGRSVMSAISQDVDTMLEDLNTAKDNVPDFMDHIGDALASATKMSGDTVFGNRSFQWGESDDLNKIQKDSEDAIKALDNFKKSGVTMTELRDAVAGSSLATENLKNKFRDAGDGADQMIAKFDELQRKFHEADEAAKEVGTSGVLLAQGIKKIAEAGDDATSKLEALNTILRSLGKDKTSSLEAMQAYEKEIRDLVKATQGAVAGGASIDDLIDKNTGSFNLATEAGSNLFDVFKGLSGTFKANAAKNGNATEAYAKFLEQIDKLNGTIPLTRDQLIGLAKDLGVMPTDINFSLSLVGKDPFYQDIAAAYLKGQELVGQGVEIPVSVTQDNVAVAKGINDILKREVARVGKEGNIILSPTITAADLQAILTELNKIGIGNQQQQGKPLKLNLDDAGKIVGTTTGNDPALDKKGEQLTTFTQTVIDGLQRLLDGTGTEADKSGQKFMEAFAQGIANSDVAEEELRKKLTDMLANLHHSPPKKGPLSAYGGDAVLYGGKKFGEAYATGINASTGKVAGAATNMVGAAGASLKGDKMYETGQFLGQITQLMDFAQHFVDVFDKLSQTVLSFTKFISDPLGKGTFFGSSKKFKRDPGVTDEALAKSNADAAQQRMFSFQGSGQRPDLYDPATGQLRGPNVGSLPVGADKQATANYIIDKAMSLGYTRAQANEFLVQAVGESHLAPDANNPAGWNGIFQFDVPTWEQAGGGNVQNAQKNIDNYFELARQRGLTPQTFNDPHQLGTQISIGGPLNPKNVGHEAIARADAEQYIKNYQTGAGQFTAGIQPGIPVLPGNIKPSSKLTNSDGKMVQLPAARAAALLEAAFPGITSIGGARNDDKFAHPAGRALDVGIGSDLKLGDDIRAWVQANATALGVQSTIWRNRGENLVANEGGGAGTTYDAEGHFDHVHIQFADGATITQVPGGTDIQVPVNSPYTAMNFGLPLTPEQLKETPPAPKEMVIRNPDGSFSPVHGGAAGLPGQDIPINPLTGLPWTDQEASEFWNRPENAMQYDRKQLQPGDESVPGIFQGTQEELLDVTKQGNQFLAGILDGTNAQLTQGEAIEAANQLQVEIDKQTALDTPTSRARAQALSGVQSNITSQYGLAEDDPIGQAGEVISAISGVASDIFKVINSGIEAIGATKDIADTLVRYPSNTEDVFRMIDDFQKYITFAADIAGAVSSVTSAIGSLVGAGASADPSGGAGGAAAAIQGISQIAAVIQGALETVNAVIDLGQEAYRIIGTYVGDFLGFLVGGEDSLRGNIKFLLDTQTNQLLAYSQDNPLDKRVHDGVGGAQNTLSRNQLIGNINVYGGPGRDPRDDTRQMVYQVKASQMAVATGQ